MIWIYTRNPCLILDVKTRAFSSHVNDSDQSSNHKEYVTNLPHECEIGV